MKDDLPFSADAMFLVLLLGGIGCTMPIIALVAASDVDRQQDEILKNKIENTSVITFEDGAIDVINSYIDRNNNDQTIYISLLTEEQYEELKESDYVKMEPITAFFTEEDYQKYNKKSITEEDLNEIINQINSEYNGEALSLTNN